MGLSFSARLITSLSLSVASIMMMAQNQVVPTTTLSAQTGNNTSAANSFAGTPNGNIGAANISKMPMQTMLYPGSTTKIYAHLMGWFGSSSHINVGYDSADPNQVKRQVTDMMSRGISGAILDWYGPGNTHTDAAGKALMAEAQNRNGQFTFAMIEDVGALGNCATTAGCDVTQKMIDDLNYMYTTYVTSPAYMTVNGRPLEFFFGEERYNIDWTRARANVLGNPIFIFRNSGGYSYAQSGGGFGWVAPETVSASDPMALNYLNGFYSTSLKNPGALTFGSAYKGFSDTIAAWGSGRIIQQNCGTTWVQSMAQAGRYYSASKQLPALQLVTWNDYEEGTALEMGIDNCVSLAGSVDASGNLAWTVSGNEAMIDHYTVYISADGQNLMKITDIANGTHTLNIASYGFAAGKYSLFVQAIGLPTMTNKMSAPIAYTASTSGPTPTASLTMSTANAITGAAVTANAGGSAGASGTITKTVINWGDGVTTSSAVNPASVTHAYLSVGNYTVTETVTNSSGATASTSAQLSVKSAGVVAIASPTANQNVSLMPTVVAAATSPYPLAMMQVYVDNTLTFQSSSASISAGMKLSPGGHTVLVRQTDVNGNITQNSVNVVAVNQAPVAALALSTTVSSANMSVTATTAGSADPDGTIKSATIDWGDGTLTNGASGTHTYAAPGAYTVVATVIDNYGASTSTAQTAAMDSSAHAITVVSPKSGTNPLAVLMQANAAGASGVTAMQIYVDNVLQYTASGASVNTTLKMSAGAHQVNFKAWDATGASWMAAVPITVQNYTLSTSATY